MHSPRRLYTTRDRKTIVEEGDPRAAFILIGEFTSYNKEMDERHGISEYLKANPTKAEPSQPEKPVESKAVDSKAVEPAQNKAIFSKKTK